MSQVVLAVIATTLVVIALFGWSLIYYIPAILDGSDHAEDSHADPGHPS